MTAFAERRVRPYLRGAALGALAPLRRLRATPPGLRVVIYHHVGADDRGGLRRQLGFLGRRGKIVSIAEAMQILAAKRRLDMPYYCITFDDGLSSFYDHAWPVLCDLRVPAALFVVSDLVGSDGFITWEQCRAMSGSSLITIGSHTVHHARLASLSEAAARSELAQSKAAIEAEIGEPCQHFGCPFGGASDFIADRDPALAREAGYASFLTSIRGVNGADASPYLVRRHNIASLAGTAELEYFVT